MKYKVWLGQDICVTNEETLEAHIFTRGDLRSQFRKLSQAERKDIGTAIMQSLYDAWIKQFEEVL